MSKIEWTDATYNPIIGCSKISAGCENCYAEKMAGRLASIKTTMDNYANVVDIKQDKTGDVKFSSEWNGTTHFVESALKKPLKRKKPTTYFVCSMGDLFHESVPFSWIMDVMDVIEDCPQHTFQILTKRPERMLEYFGSIKDHEKSDYKVLPNLWLGVTAENQDQANKRIPILLEIPATIRFVSIEPMLSAVNLEGIKQIYQGKHISSYQVLQPIKNCGDSNRPALDWVICGGESGSKARPMHPDWVRSLRDQCKATNVPFFFKQWGEYSAIELSKEQKIKDKYIVLSNDGKEYLMAGENLTPVYMIKVGKKKAGSLLDGVEHKNSPISK